MQTINLGGFQSPYFEQEVVIPPYQNLLINYAYNDFQLLDADLIDTLEVTFGGSGIQSRFSAGMGYKLPEPVQYVQFFNTSTTQPITIRFALAIGDIRDNRLVVSGVVNTLTELATSSNITWETINATTPQTYTLPVNCKVSILVASGSVSLNLANNTGGGITLQSGQAVEFSTSASQDLSISGGTINLQIEEY